MANIIDLTQDLRDDEDEPQFPLLDQRRPVSPEVQYVGSRSRTPPQDVAYYLQLSRTLAAAEQRDAARSRSSEHALWRRHRPTVPSQRRPLPLFFGPQAHDDLVGMEMFNSTGPRTLPMPQLDFTMTGFDMHYSTRSNMQRPSMPTYEAPKPARQGFSRSASLGKEFMCPRCQCELGTKPEGAEREVWVISRCGHVRLPVSLSISFANASTGLLRLVCSGSYNTQARIQICEKQS